MTAPLAPLSTMVAPNFDIWDGLLHLLMDGAVY